jgi:branched-chain amino acid transport system ATP-binding protein
LVNIMTGFYMPDAGNVRLSGIDMTGRSIAEIANAGVVRTFQTPRLFSDLTVAENLMAGQFRRRSGSLTGAIFGTRGSNAISAASASEARDLAAALGISHLLEQQAGELSQGNQRLLEIARALSAAPSFLILDEPAAGQTHQECGNLCALLENLRSIGLGILLIEHHMDVVMRVCDRITVLNRGSVMAEGTPEEIRTNTSVQQTYLGSRKSAMRTGE